MFGLSNKVPYIAEGTAKLPEVKFGDTKTIGDPNLGRKHVVQFKPIGRIFFKPSTLTFGIFPVS